MNKIILIGRLTKDPDLRYTPNGAAVCTITLAVNRPYAKDGEQDADFIKLREVSGKRAPMRDRGQIANPYL